MKHEAMTTAQPPGQSTAQQPLAGLRVLDLTRNVAGPYATMILGDLGAAVTKVEHPGGGDDSRQWGPPFIAGESAIYLGLNRNKESITLDLAKPEAMEIMTRLVQSSDVLVESFRPGALAALGFGPSWARSLNPQLVYCSITGYGQSGPLRDRPGYDPLIQAYSGLMSLTGEPGRPPVRVAFSVIDMGTGLWAALATVSALYRRHQTGTGEWINTSLYETAMAWALVPLSTYWGSGEPPPPLGSGTNAIVPNRAYETRDGYLMIGGNNDRLFQRLCAVLGHPEWPADPRFRHNPDRVGQRDVLDELVNAATREWHRDELAERLLQAGVPCAPVRSLPEAAADEHAAALGLFQHLSGGPLAALPLVAMPFSTTDGRPPVRQVAPALGEHNQAVLRRLGYSETEAKSLARSPAMQPPTPDQPGTA